MLLLLVFKQTNITNTILFVISLDRQKKKERVLIGEELQIRFSLRGNTDADVLCDMTRPLGTLLAEFEHDPDGEWSRLGLMPLRKALHSNRWKQPALEKSAGEFLAKKYLTGRLFLAESLRYELCSDKCRKAQSLQNIGTTHSHFNRDAFLWCW